MHYGNGRRWIVGVALALWFTGAPVVAVLNLHGHASTVAKHELTPLNPNCPAYVEPPTACPAGWHVASSEERKLLVNWTGDFLAEAARRRRDAQSVSVEAWQTAIAPFGIERSKELAQTADSLSSSAWRFEVRAPRVNVCLSGHPLIDDEVRCCQGQLVDGPNADVDNYSAPSSNGPRCS